MNARTLTTTERLHRLRSLTFSKTVFVVILLCTLAGTVVGYLRALRQPFVFRVWTSVLLEVGREGAGANPEVIAAGGSPFITLVPRSDDLNTELQLLKSPALMQEVYDSLMEEGALGAPGEKPEDGEELEEGEEAGGGGSILGLLLNGINSLKRALKLDYQTDPATRHFQGFQSQFGFVAVPKSTIIEINCTSPNPEVAKMRLERFLTKYKDFHMRAFSKAENTVFFEQQRAAIRERIKVAEQAFKEFRQQHGIVVLEPTLAHLVEQRDNTIVRLRNLEAEQVVNDARLARINADLASGKYPEYSVLSMHANINPAREYLERLVIDAELDVATLGDRFHEATEWVTQARAKQRRLIDLLDRQKLVRDGGESRGRDPIHTALVQNQLSAETQRVVLGAEREALIASLNEINDEIRRLEDLRPQYEELRLAVAELERDEAKLRESLRLSRANLAFDNARVTNLKVITPPTIPPSPATRFGMSPRLFTTLGGGGAGLFLSLAFFLVRGAIRESLAQRATLAAVAAANAEQAEAGEDGREVWIVDVPGDVSPGDGGERREPGGGGDRLL